MMCIHILSIFIEFVQHPSANKPVYRHFEQLHGFLAAHKNSSTRLAQKKFDSKKVIIKAASPRPTADVVVCQEAAGCACP